MAWQPVAGEESWPETSVRRLTKGMAVTCRGKLKHSGLVAADEESWPEVLVRMLSVMVYAKDHALADQGAAAW